MAKKPKPEILVYTKYFYPAYKSGGPVRTLLNMVEQLHEWYNFKIVASDRDFGDTCTFPDIQPGQWMETEKYSVLYLSPEQSNFKRFRRIPRETSHDIVYLNSFFCFRFSILPLALMHIRMVPQKPVILAPRGEFSEGALKLKWFKKRAYIAFAKATGLYKNIIWQASSEYEERDIRKWLGELAVVHIAPDLTPANAGSVNQELYQNRRKKEKDFLKIIFLSRISPMKNLDGALRILEKVKGNVEMNIYGPVTDETYWEKCREIIDRMPDNVKVTYKGSVPHEEVPKAMAEHDLFFFPTHGENFGHVINEALSVGTPVLISNRTPWRDLEERQAGWDLSLSNEEKIINVVEFCCSMPSQEFFKYNKGAYSFIASSVKSTGAIEANRKIFKEAYHLPGDNGGNKKMKVTYYQRKPLGNQYSIERVFEAVREALPEEVTYKVFLCPFQSKGIIRRMLNCLAAIFFQGDINHITGDVHYLALLLSKKKTVLTIHDCRSLNRLKGLRRKIFKLFWFDIPIKRSSIVTAISSFTKQELLEQVHCPEEKIIVVPDPVTKGFAFKPKRFNENNPVILQIGTGSNKNLERVVQACEGLDVTLDVVGKLTNEQKTLLEEKAIRYSNSYNLSDYEIKQKYENCDIVVFASIYEGFGMPILEAQATGRPVITSNIEPMKEVAGEGAYLVDPYDVQEIRQGISRICQDASLRKRIIKKGHDNIKYFTSMTIAKQYVDIYKKITKGSL